MIERAGSMRIKTGSMGYVAGGRNKAFDLILYEGKVKGSEELKIMSEPVFRITLPSIDVLYIFTFWVGRPIGDQGSYKNR